MAGSLKGGALFLYLEASDYKQSWDVELADGFCDILHVFFWKGSDIGYATEN